MAKCPRALVMPDLMPCFISSAEILPSMIPSVTFSKPALINPVNRALVNFCSVLIFSLSSSSANWSSPVTTPSDAVPPVAYINAICAARFGAYPIDVEKKFSHQSPTFFELVTQSDGTVESSCAASMFSVQCLLMNSRPGVAAIFLASAGELILPLSSGTSPVSSSCCPEYRAFASAAAAAAAIPTSSFAAFAAVLKVPSAPSYNFHPVFPKIP